MYGLPLCVGGGLRLTRNPAENGGEYLAGLDQYRYFVTTISTEKRCPKS